MQNNGIGYFFQGLTLIRTKGLKRFVLIPFSVNLILFSIALYFLVGQVEGGINYIINIIPDWEWLAWFKQGVSYILWPLALISILLIFALVFGTLANWIAAPFNGVLAEKVERHLSGQQLGDTGVLDIIKDIPRTLGREMAKLAYYIPRALGFLILFFLLPVFGQVLWFLFTAWMMAIQYCDYSFDNHKIGFKTMRYTLNQSRSNCFSFGVMVSVFSMIPIVNFLVMPVAICGATSMWVNDLKYKLPAVK